MQIRKENNVAKHIKRSKIIRSYDGLDREEKTGGLMFMRVLVILLMIGFIAGCMYMLVNNIIDENKSLSDTDTPSVRYRSYTADESEMLIRFYNASYPLPENYTVNTVQYSDTVAVNSLMIDDLNEMIKAAHDDGVELSVVKCYADQKECDRAFSMLKAEYERSGATLAEAESMARAISPPGNMNEFATGLLITFSDDDSYAFSKTKAYQWLYKNGIEYGFINRYTSDKENITGIKENLTVYRYVGSDNASKMRSFGMCLEEYYDYCSYRQ